MYVSPGFRVFFLVIQKIKSLKPRTEEMGDIMQMPCPSFVLRGRTNPVTRQGKAQISQCTKKNISQWYTQLYCLISYLGISRSFHILGLVRNGQFYSTVIINNYSIFSFLKSRHQNSAISVLFVSKRVYYMQFKHLSHSSFTVTAQ